MVVGKNRGTDPSGDGGDRVEDEMGGQGMSDKHERKWYLLQVICMLGGVGIGPVHVLRHWADLPLLHCLD